MLGKRSCVTFVPKNVSLRSNRTFKESSPKFFVRNARDRIWRGGVRAEGGPRARRDGPAGEAPKGGDGSRYFQRFFPRRVYTPAVPSGRMQGPSPPDGSSMGGTQTVASRSWIPCPWNTPAASGVGVHRNSPPAPKDPRE